MSNRRVIQKSAASTPAEPVPFIQQLVDRLAALEETAAGAAVMMESHSQGLQNLGNRLHRVEVQFPQGALE